MELAKSGFEIILAGRNLAALGESKNLIENNGGKTEVIQTDLSDIKTIETLVNKIKLFTSKIDLIANIAGIWHGENEVYSGINLENFDDKIIVDTLNVGITTPMLLVKKLIPMMDEGDVINLSGTFENGGKGWLPYYVSKRALEDFTIGLADELKEKQIKVNCVSPSDTATDSYKKYFPQYIKDSLDPKEIAKLFIKIIESKETGKIWVVKKGKEITKGFHN